MKKKNYKKIEIKKETDNKYYLNIKLKEEYFSKYYRFLINKKEEQEELKNKGDYFINRDENKIIYFNKSREIVELQYLTYLYHETTGDVKYTAIKKNMIV